MPTTEQAYSAIFVCQMLSNMLQPINVFPYDRKLKTLYVQGGVEDTLQIVISEGRNWEFV